MYLDQLFESAQSKSKDTQYLFRASKGREFEKNILDILTRDASYIEISKDYLTDSKNFKEFKEGILDMKTTKSIIKNKFFKELTKGRNVIIREPFGSQCFPDFILMNNERVLPFEVKFSTKGNDRPTWNSGLPRSSAVYIFGSYLSADITFFLGKDYISNDKRKKLVSIFETLDKQLKSLTDVEGKEQFSIYLRRMYKQTFSSLKGNNRDKFENNTLKFVKQII